MFTKINAFVSSTRVTQLLHEADFARCDVRMRHFDSACALLATSVL